MATKSKATPASPVTISLDLRKRIIKSAKAAFRAFDRNTGVITSRCHNVSKNELQYRLPAGARSVAGQAVVVRRQGKNIIVSKTVVTGVNPR